MPRPFVEHYDALYADKDYDADIEAFEALAGPLRGRKLLEIGAGTGNHSQRLAARAGRLVSVEIDPDFGEILRRKSIPCFIGPLERLEEREFDAAAAFFHVFNYIGRKDLAPFLAALAQRMKPGAAFVTDLWNADAVRLDPPRTERREKTGGLLQEIRPEVDGDRVSLHYRITLHGRSFDEILLLQLWSAGELSEMLTQAGFRDVTFRDYRDVRAGATEKSWKMWLRATKGPQ